MLSIRPIISSHKTKRLPKKLEEQDLVLWDWAILLLKCTCAMETKRQLRQWRRSLKHSETVHMMHQRILPKKKVHSLSLIEGNILKAIILKRFLKSFAKRLQSREFEMQFF